MTSLQRRFVYAIALVGWLVFSAGSVLLVREITGAVLSSDPLAAAIAERRGWLLVGLIMGSIGLLAWGLAWSSANRVARPLTMAGAAERAAAARKACLYLGLFFVLSAAVVQAGMALYESLSHLLSAPTQHAWPAWTLTSVTGAIAALAGWGYLRWQISGDGDLGQEAEHAVSWRRAYVYAVTAAGVALAVAGLGESLRALLQAAVRPLDPNNAWHASLAAALALGMMGAPLAVLGWRRANHLAENAPEVERNALSRTLFLYAGITCGAMATSVCAGYLLALILLRALGAETGVAASHWPIAVAYLPGSLSAWLVFALGIRRDRRLTAESPLTGAVRRVAWYGVAALGLASLWLGLAEFARLILSVILVVMSNPDKLVLAQVWSGRFAVATALVLVGAPIWWGYWQSLQARARAAGTHAQAERTSAMRRTYLFSVVMIAAILSVACIGFGVFLILSGAAQATAGTELRAALAGTGAVLAVALPFLAGHLLVLRRDARLLRIASEAPALNPTRRAVTPSPQAPLTYLREDLSRLAAAAPARPALQPPGPIAVVDGRDGAIGAGLLAALRRAYPTAVFWPMGLNAAAHAALLNALGNTAPPAVPLDALRRAAVILGPSDILTPGGLAGEVTAEIAEQLASSSARVLLLPPRDRRLHWVAAPEWPMDRWIDKAVVEVTDILGPR